MTRSSDIMLLASEDSKKKGKKSINEYYNCTHSITVIHVSILIIYCTV